MKKTKKISWGILGAGRVNERFIPAILSSINSELVAIGSRRTGAAADVLKKYAPDYKNVIAFDSFEELINHQNVQAVYMPLANEEHAEWAIKAIEKGKHVLLEKPMAIHFNEILIIQERAKKYKVKVMEGFMYYFHPQHSVVKELISSGLIGEIRTIKASYSFLIRPERRYRLSRDANNGGGVIWDIGPYAIHTLRIFFTSNPKSVTAVAEYIDNGADISANGILDFGDGKIGQFDISFNSSRQSEYTIIGTKGGIRCHKVWQLPNNGDTPEISWWTDNGQFRREIYPASNHFAMEIDHFSDCILNNSEPALSLEDAYFNCVAIQAVLKSAAQNKTIYI